MAQPTLFQFLTRTQIPDIPLRPGLGLTPNTRSNAYPLNKVTTGQWNLTYQDITHSQYAPILTNTEFTNYLQTSPPEAVGAERSVEARLLYLVFKRLERALRATTFPAHHSSIKTDTGDAARLSHSNGKPDLVGYTGHDPHRVLRVPGDVKCSWKFHSTWITSLFEDLRAEFYAVVAQINYYMNHARSRYGYVITDTELVLFRKREGRFASYVEVAPGIPLNRYDSLGNMGPNDIGPYNVNVGHITALLGLWYIHLLAANDANWLIQDIYSDPEDDEDQSGSYGDR